MKFHPDKCKIMNINKKGENRKETQKYKLMNRELQLIEEEKDIGVIIDSQITFDKHITEKIKKRQIVQYQKNV